MTAVLALVLAGQPVAPTRDFLVLRNAPEMRDKRGRHIPPMHLLLRKVSLLKKESKGRFSFRIPGGGIAYCASPKLFDSDSLAPLAESGALAALRKKYLGKRVWTYGDQALWCEQPGGKLEGDVETSPLHSVKIEQIYQLARKPVKFRESASGFGGFYVYGDLNPKEYGPDEMYVFVISAPNLRISGGSGDFTDRDRVRSRFGPLYTLVLGTWSLPQRYSMAPPPAWAEKAILKLATAFDYGAALVGLSHREVAWAYGWLGARKTFSEMLKQRVWDFENGYQITFSGDRVVDAYRHLPH